MPKLQQYTHQRLPTGQLQVRQASSTDFGGDLGLTGLGSSLQQTGDLIRKRQEREEMLRADQQLANDRVVLAGKMRQLQKELPHGGVGIEEAMEAELAEFGDPSQFQTRAASQAYISKLTNLKADTQIRAGITGAAAFAAQEKFVTKETLETLNNTVRADPTQADATLEQGLDMISRMQIGEDVKNIFSEEFRESTWVAAAEGSLSQVKTVEQAEALEDVFMSDVWQSRLTPEKYSQVLAKIDQRVNTLTSQRETSVAQDMNERFREVSNGIGLDRLANDRLIIKSSITDPDKRAKMLKSLDDNARVGAVYGQVTGMSAQQINDMGSQLVNELQKPGDFDVDSAKIKAYQHAVDRRNKEMSADVVAYTAKVNPDVALKYQAWKENQNPETLDAFVTATATEQIRQGVDPRRIRILDTGDINHMRLDMRDLDENKGPQEIAVKITNMRDAYGEYWPMVNRQLQQEKVFTGYEALVTSLVDTNPAAADDLLLASRLTDDHFKKVIPDFQKVKGEMQANVIDTMSEFFGTVMNQPGQQRVIQDHSQAVNQLALYYHSRGMGRGDAVTTAANQIVLDNYDFAEGFRIPKSIEASPSSIVNGTDEILRTMDMSDIIPFVSITPGMTQERVKEDSIRTIRSTGRWLTNGDESGLILVNAEGNAVEKLVDGRPQFIEFTWSDIINQGFIKDAELDMESVEP